MLVAVELLTTGLTAAGIALLVAALVLRCIEGSWVRTEAVHSLEAGTRVLRWHDTRYELRERALAAGVHEGCAPGDECAIYYRARKPEQWTSRRPHRGARFAALAGLVLTVAGILLTFTAV